MNGHKERGKQQAPDVQNNSCTEQQQLHSSTLERILETPKHSLKHHESPPEKYSYQTRESPHSSSALSTACSTTIQTVKVGDQLPPHCRFSMYCRCIRRCLPGKPWSVTCGPCPVDCVLWWNVPCFTNLCALKYTQSTWRILFSIVCLGHSTVPRRWAASADFECFTCSWPHAKPALFSRLLLLLQHSLMNLETESAVLATPVFVSFTRFK